MKNVQLSHIQNEASFLQNGIDFEWTDDVGSAITEKIEDACTKAFKECEYAVQRLRELDLDNDKDALEKMLQELESITI